MNASSAKESIPATQPLIDIRNLTIRFGDRIAVQNTSFHIANGETVAVIGESGSGKSVTALALTRLLPPEPSCNVSGEILFCGKNINKLSEKELRAIRGKEIAYIFQEPSASLNPVFTIGAQIKEALRLHRPDVKDTTTEIIHLLDMVGIESPQTRYRDYPHQLSGGMQQRVMIAMALACRPAILIADEPTTALDVTIQLQIIDLLKELKQKLGMSILIITHNFGIISGFADRVMVMFRGNIVESGTTQNVLRNPQHPYTQALIDCIPRLGQNKERLATIDYSKIDQYPL